MIRPFFNNTRQLVQYIFIWILYALLHAFVLNWLVRLPFWILLTDGFIHAAIFGVLCILIWNVIKYGNFAALQLYQQIVNHIALAVLSLIIWVGGSYGLFYLAFNVEEATQFIPVLPILGFIGLLIYVVIIQLFRSEVYIDDKFKAFSDALPLIEEQKPRDIVPKEVIERIAVKSGTKIHVILIPEILYLQADGDYVQIFTAQGKFLKEQTMKYFEEHLPENQFVRVHRSTIVNVEMISRIELYEKQNQLLTLKNGQQIKTSPAGYNTLRSVLNL